jgi:hypothetical protein
VGDHLDTHHHHPPRQRRNGQETTMSVHEHATNWTPDQERLITWLALPKAEKTPKTQSALAKELCIDAATLWRWKQLPGLMEEVQRRAKQAMRDDTAEVLGAIRRAAKKGSVPHINMFLAMTGLAGDVEAAGKGPSEDTNGARTRLAALLEKHLAAAPAGDAPGADPGA